MIHRSVETEIAGRKFRLYYGYGAQKRMGFSNSLDLLKKLEEVFVRNQRTHKVIAIRKEPLEELIWGGLYQSTSPDGRRLLPESLSKAEVAVLVEDHIETSLDAGAESQDEAHAELAGLVERAVVEANVWPKQKKKPKADEDEPTAEAGEATEDPTLPTPSPSAPNSESRPAAA